VFFAALISIFYHLGIMQLVIRWIGGGLEWVTGISRVEALCAASNIFVGQSESPLVIRPYLAALSPAQMFCVMTVGMAGVAGTILAAYAAMGIRTDYLVAAAFMSAPGGVLMAKLIMPDGLPTPPAQDNTLLQNPQTAVSAPDEERPANLIMAASQGAQTGVRLAVAVGAMVLAFVALVAMANGILGGIGGRLGYPNLSFQQILGTVFAPVFFLLGAPTWAEAARAGGLFGTKIVLNEFVAFIDLGAAKDLSARTAAIVTFALCGFANFSSIAIQMAVSGSLAPNQRAVIARLGMKALAAGALSNLMSAALAGLFLSV
jgi:CNT family concentrative nucleoside transporter